MIYFIKHDIPRTSSKFKYQVAQQKDPSTTRPHTFSKNQDFPAPAQNPITWPSCPLLLPKEEEAQTLCLSSSTTEDHIV